MPAVPFDTLKLADRLAAGGFTVEQAHTAASALAEVGTAAELATQTDVNASELAVRRDLTALEAAVKRDLFPEHPATRSTFAASIAFRSGWRQGIGREVNEAYEPT